MELPTAHYHDTYAGWIEAHVEKFTTKRRGERVTRYRWRAGSGLCGYAAGVAWSTPEAAARAVINRADFANIKLPVEG